MSDPWRGREGAAPGLVDWIGKGSDEVQRGGNGHAEIRMRQMTGDKRKVTWCPINLIIGFLSDNPDYRTPFLQTSDNRWTDSRLGKDKEGTRIGYVLLFIGGQPWSHSKYISS